MKIDIRIATPSPGDYWGDTAFAESLKGRLASRGAQAKVVFRRDWGAETCAEIVLYLAGHVKSPVARGRVNLLWVLYGHKVWSLEELKGYDWVFVASERIAKDWSRMGVNASVLNQAVDESMVGRRVQGEQDIDVLFVGTHYTVEGVKVRKVVADLRGADTSGMRVRVVGNWEKVLPKEWVMSRVVRSRELFGLYSRARIVLGGHLPSMVEGGFVNNRVFDLAEIGAFQLQERMRELEEYGIEMFGGPGELGEKLRRYLGDRELRAKVAEEVRGRLIGNDFGNRADEILRRINGLSAHIAGS